MSEILKLNSLEKRFGSNMALHNVNLSIESGKIVGLLGPNGSGKTTLLKIANGLLQPTSGEILIGGEKPGVETKSMVSYLPERTYINNWMRAKDLLDFFGDFYADFDRSKAVDMLSSLGIEPNTKLKEMSKGTKEKVQLVLVMSRQAKLYLLDEPIGGVDPAARDYILNTIISNYNENSTVIISTHLIQDVEKLFDEVIFLSKGEVLFHDSVDNVREKNGKSIDQLFREVFKC
ncbi:MAG: ABC transporter ATP-binding protein [Eubacteriales bacterium]|jgi:ABC-2 type transport system ATP-binding protein|nr:ABC transporter ATP-binding protein [Eubacteriales bacterium]